MGIPTSVGRISICGSLIMAAEFRKDQGIDLRSDKMALQRLKEAAEKAKMELSTAMETDMTCPLSRPMPAVPNI